MMAVPAEAAAAAARGSSACSPVCALRGHEDRVWHVSWAADGRLLASCSTDRVVRIWGRREGEHADAWCCLAALEDAQSRTIRSCEWSPTGRYLAAVSFDGSCAIWEKSNAPGAAAAAAAASAASTPEEAAAAAATVAAAAAVTDAPLQLHFELVAMLEGHENEVKSVSWSADGQLLATCSRDKSIWVWELVGENDFECVTVLHGHTQDVKFVQWHPKDPYFFSCSYDDSIKVWAEEEDDWYCVDTLHVHTSTVWGLAFNATGTMAVSCSDDCNLCVWKHFREGDRSATVGKWKHVSTVPNLHEQCIYSVDWAASGARNGAPGGDGGAVLTGAGDNAINILLHNTPDGSSSEVAAFHVEEHIADAHAGDINSVRWNPRDHGLFASAGDDGLIKLWRYTPS